MVRRWCAGEGGIGGVWVRSSPTSLLLLAKFSVKEWTEYTPMRPLASLLSTDCHVEPQLRQKQGNPMNGERSESYTGSVVARVNKDRAECQGTGAGCEKWATRTYRGCGPFQAYSVSRATGRDIRRRSKEVVKGREQGANEMLLPSIRGRKRVHAEVSAGMATSLPGELPNCTSLSGTKRSHH